MVTDDEGITGGCVTLVAMVTDDEGITGGCVTLVAMVTALEESNKLNVENGVVVMETYMLVVMLVAKLLNKGSTDNIVE